jgi:hypothetical protein
MKVLMVVLSSLVCLSQGLAENGQKRIDPPKTITVYEGDEAREFILTFPEFGPLDVEHPWTFFHNLSPAFESELVRRAVVESLPGYEILTVEPMVTDTHSTFKVLVNERGCAYVFGADSDVTVFSDLVVHSGVGVHSTNEALGLVMLFLDLEGYSGNNLIVRTSSDLRELGESEFPPLQRPLLQKGGETLAEDLEAVIGVPQALETGGEFDVCLFTWSEWDDALSLVRGTVRRTGAIQVERIAIATVDSRTGNVIWGVPPASARESLSCSKEMNRN